MSSFFTILSNDQLNTMAMYQVHNREPSSYHIIFPSEENRIRGVNFFLSSKSQTYYLCKIVSQFHILNSMNNSAIDIVNEDMHAIYYVIFHINSETSRVEIAQADYVGTREKYMDLLG